MTVSFSALLSTVLLSSAIIFVQIILINKLQINRLLPATFLMIVSMVFILRLCFPVEFFFTKTIPSDVILPYIDSFLKKESLTISNFSISWGKLLIAFWFLGSVVFFTRFYLLIRKIQTLKRLMMVNPNFKYRNRTVYLVNQAISPVVVGIVNPIIILPNLNISEKQREYILEHELFHISTFDIWIKYAYELLTIIYWWNPVIYIFKRSFNQIIELKADENVVSRLNTREKIEYVETLLEVASQSKCEYFKSQSSFFPSFTSNNQNYLLERADHIFSEHKSKPNKLIITLFAIFCFYLSSCIVLETYYVEPHVKNTTITITEKDSFLLRTNESNYKVYNNNIFLFEVSDEDRKKQFPKIKIFDSIKEGEKYVKKND